MKLQVENLQQLQMSWSSTVKKNMALQAAPDAPARNV